MIAVSIPILSLWVLIELKNIKLCMALAERGVWQSLLCPFTTFSLVFHSFSIVPVFQSNLLHSVLRWISSRAAVKCRRVFRVFSNLIIRAGWSVDLISWNTRRPNRYGLSRYICVRKIALTCYFCWPYTTSFIYILYCIPKEKLLLILVLKFKGFHWVVQSNTFQLNKKYIVIQKTYRRYEVKNWKQFIEKNLYPKS